MSDFEPSVIADLQAGLFNAKQPWLSPQATFRDMENTSVFRGRLVTRRGYSLFGTVPDTNPITGIFNFKPTSGVEFLVVTTTRNTYRWNDGAETFDPITGGNIWTGSKDDFVWFTPFEDLLFMNNGVDAPKVYDPLGSNNVRDAATDIDGGGGNDITSAKLTVRHRGRLLYLHTSESGATYPQRIRRTAINNAESFQRATDFADIPTNAQIVSAAVANDQIVVFCSDQETWLHRYTGDPVAPYDLIKLSALRGADARMATVELDGNVLGLSFAGLIQSDGASINDVDASIPEFFETFVDASGVSLTNAIVVNERDEVWFAVAKAGNTEATNVLVYNFKTGAFSVHAMPMRTFGFWSQQATELWDDQTDPPGLTWDQEVGTWDEDLGVVGFPILLGGDATGNVWRLLNSDLDNTMEISAVSKTQRLNPYRKTARCHLGYLQVLCDAAAGKELEFRFFADFSGAPYLIESVDLTPDDPQATKVRRVVRVNQIADYHQFEIVARDLPGHAIDGLALYTKPAGKIRAI